MVPEPGWRRREAPGERAADPLQLFPRGAHRGPRHLREEDERCARLARGCEGRPREHHAAVEPLQAWSERDCKAPGLQQARQHAVQQFLRRKQGLIMRFPSREARRGKPHAARRNHRLALRSPFAASRRGRGHHLRRPPAAAAAAGRVFQLPAAAAAAARVRPPHPSGGEPAAGSFLAVVEHERMLLQIDSLYSRSVRSGEIR
mmetsp:Transcript_70394/g.170029  ORF Transcript_70394/g.170029 Transcript_70394/m.170029 type:complete len:203 (-) Transcript_70394:40-648(-)